MSRNIQFVRCLTTVFTVTISFSSLPVLAQNIEAPATTGPSRAVQRIARLALIGDVEQPQQTSTEATTEPLPFASSIMTSDSIPPHAAHPGLNDVMPASYAEPIVTIGSQPDRVNSDEAETIDDCCRQLTSMIAGNLDSEISIEAKAKMIETALKMVARDVALRAEAEITQLKADHALEMARMHGQMMNMRAVANAADQINRIAGPLHQILEKNYQQSVAMNQANQQVAQMIAGIGMEKLEDDARRARESRKRITLKSPQPKPQVAANPPSRAEQILQEIDKLKHRLDAELDVRQRAENVLPATYNQPLQPRRQPLEPIRRVNQYYNDGDAGSNGLNSSNR